MTAQALSYPAIFGSNLRAARLRAGFKMSDMAERTGISPGHVSLVEHGGLEVTIQTMAALAKAVGCDLPRLLEPGVEFTNGEEPGVKLPKTNA